VQQDNIELKLKYYRLEGYGILLYRNRFYVPNSQELRNLVIKEMHNVLYVGHTSYQKNITLIRGQYYWPRMKKYVVD
jgi:hypothetical protein